MYIYLASQKILKFVLACQNGGHFNKRQEIKCKFLHVAFPSVFMKICLLFGTKLGSFGHFEPY